MRRLGLVFLIAIPGLAGFATAGVEPTPSDDDRARALLADTDERSAVAWLDRASELRATAEDLQTAHGVLDASDRQLVVSLWVAASDAAGRIGTVSPWSATLGGQAVDLSLYEAARLAATDPGVLDVLDSDVRTEVERYRLDILAGVLPAVR